MLLKSLASGKAWLNGPSENIRDLISSCPGIGAFCRSYSVPLPPSEHISAHQEHLLATFPQAHGCTFPQTPKLGYRLILEQSVSIGSKRTNWVRPGSPNLMLWKWEKGGYPKEKSVVHFNRRNGCWAAEANIHYSRSKCLPERDGVVGR